MWKNRVTDLLSVRTIVGFVASHKMCETQGMPCRLPRIRSTKSTSLVVWGRKFLIQTQQARKFSFLMGFPDLDCLQP